MLEPGGLWDENVYRGRQPIHRWLVAWLCTHFDLAAPDDEVEALTMFIVAPVVHLLVNCEIVDRLSPRLLAGTTSSKLGTRDYRAVPEIQVVAEGLRGERAEQRRALSLPSSGHWRKLWDKR